MHLALGTASVLAGVTAGLAALGLVYETLLSVELLLTGGKDELIAALFAYSSLVLVHCGYLTLIDILQPASCRYCQVENLRRRRCTALSTAFLLVLRRVAISS